MNDKGCLQTQLYVICETLGTCRVPASSPTSNTEGVSVPQEPGEVQEPSASDRKRLRDGMLPVMGNKNGWCCVLLPLLVGVNSVYRCNAKYIGTYYLTRALYICLFFNSPT
jgi:hypothetical protein